MHGIDSMPNFQEKRQLRAFFASRTILIVLLLLLLGAGIVSFRALEAGWKVQVERAAVEERLQKLEEEKRALSSELEELRSDEGVERRARQKFNYRKPGEDVVIIKDTNIAPLENGAANASFWEMIQQWFSGIKN